MRTSANRTHRAAALLGLLLAMPLLLSACGGAPEAPKVASLPTASTEPPVATSDGTSSTQTEGAEAPPTPEGESAGAPPKASEADRPRLRIDDTEDRRTTLVNAYFTCLLDNGATKEGEDGFGISAGRGGNVEPVTVGVPIPPEAEAACVGLLPVEPPELEASTNPNFHEQSLDYVACLREGGLWVELLGSQDLSWTYAEGHDVPDDPTLEQDCLIEAFGGKE
ncbi:MAG: hypothetical protein GX593_12520 [Actinomycetales bacterium]|nr:hypothetical protein [Actinomycetales bacterium]